MTDKELLELAAKAAEVEIRGWFEHTSHCGAEFYSIVTDRNTRRYRRWKSFSEEYYRHPARLQASAGGAD